MLSALINDHPEYYWAKNISINTYGYNFFDQSGDFEYSRLTETKVSVTGSTPHKAKHIKSFKKAVRKAVKKIDRAAERRPSRTKRIKAINKWICANTKYDRKHGLDKSSKYEYLHNAYGVFIKKKAVCDGYASAFKVLCDHYKIPCMINRGYAYDYSLNMELHAWNIVKVKNKWYVVDSTWSDSDSSDKWVLCGKKTISNNHFDSREKLDILGKGVFRLPKVSKKDYK